MDSSKNTWSSYTFDLNNFDKDFPSMESKNSFPAKEKWSSKMTKGSSSEMWNRLGMYILVIGAVVFLALFLSGYSWSTTVLASESPCHPTMTPTMPRVASPNVAVTAIPNTTPYGVRPFNDLNVADDEDEEPETRISFPAQAGTAGPQSTPSGTAGVWKVRAFNDY